MSDFCNVNATSAIDTGRRQMTLGAVTAGLLGLSGQSCATRPETTLPYAKPAPFTAMEFWQRILDLTNEKGKDTSRERVERAIGTKFARVVGEVESRAHFADYGVHWYFNARLSGGTSRPSLSINAEYQKVLMFSDGPLKYSPVVFESLMKGGWVKSAPLPHFYPNLHQLETDSVAIALNEYDNYVASVNIGWLTK
jgi:hypothetical protein